MGANFEIVGELLSFSGNKTVLVDSNGLFAARVCTVCHLCNRVPALGRLFTLCSNKPIPGPSCWKGHFLSRL